jgi:hypothetical protein
MCLAMFRYGDQVGEDNILAWIVAKGFLCSSFVLDTVKLRPKASTSAVSRENTLPELGRATSEFRENNSPVRASCKFADSILRLVIVRVSLVYRQSGRAARQGGSRHECISGVCARVRFQRSTVGSPLLNACSFPHHPSRYFEYDFHKETRGMK